MATLILLRADRTRSGVTPLSLLTLRPFPPALIGQAAQSTFCDRFYRLDPKRKVVSPLDIVGCKILCFLWSEYGALTAKMDPLAA